MNKSHSMHTHTHTHTSPWVRSQQWPLVNKGSCIFGETQRCIWIPSELVFPLQMIPNVSNYASGVGTRRFKRVCVRASIRPDRHAHPRTVLCLFMSAATQMDSLVLTSAASSQVSAQGDEWRIQWRFLFFQMHTHICRCVSVCVCIYMYGEH